VVVVATKACGFNVEEKTIVWKCEGDSIVLASVKASREVLNVFDRKSLPRLGHTANRVVEQQLLRTLYGLEFLPAQNPR
jgi:hypothetical protein